tara:strand:- start:3573 stop:4490 length:918 start_codon:yes stop_codon:yes gene_type:complete
MIINIISPSDNSLNTTNDGKNVEGDEIVARAWVKELNKRDEKITAFLGHSKIPPDVTIYFSPLPETKEDKSIKVLYLQNVFPKPNWPGTVEMFHIFKNQYDNFIFPSQGLKDKTKDKDSLVLQFAADHEIYKPNPITYDLAHNLCFVGNNFRSPDVTEQFLMCTSEMGLALYGNPASWNNFLCRGKITPEDESKLYSSSKICLNLHLKEHLENGTFNLRIFNILASGGFVISDHSEKLEKEFGDCIVFTTGHQDLKDKCNFYLDNPNETIPYRQAGLKKINDSHTFRHRMDNLSEWLKLLLETTT